MPESKPPFSIQSNELAQIVEFASAVAREAGALAVAYSRNGFKTTSKGFRDLVTEVDHAAQQLIAERVKARYPTHHFLGEEGDAQLTLSQLSAESDPIWIVDPIDGTSNFSHSLPIYCISIGVTHAGNLLAGVIYDPVHDALYCASRDQASTCNGRPIQVSAHTDLIDCVIAFDWNRDPDVRQRAIDVVGRVVPQTQTARALGSAALALCWIASGNLDGYFNFSLKVWDVAAAALILEQAGGKIGTVDGKPFSLLNPESWHVATNGNIDPQFLPLFV